MSTLLRRTRHRTIFLTARARPSRPDPHLLLNLARLVLPATILTAAYRLRLRDRLLGLPELA